MALRRALVKSEPVRGLAVSHKWEPLGKEISLAENFRTNGFVALPVRDSKTAHQNGAPFVGDPYGTRTHVFTVRG